MIRYDVPAKPPKKSCANGVNLILGGHLACRDPSHIRRWSNAGVRARTAMIKCEGVTRTGTRCRLIPVPGSTCCKHHTKGRAKDETDRIRAAKAVYKMENRSKDGVEYRRAVRTMQAIARRALHKLWANDPRIPGSTLELDEQIEAKVAAWLFDRHGIRLNGKPVLNCTEPPTFRCIDRLRWCAYRALRRGENLTDDFLRRCDLRVAAAIRDDHRFWERMKKLDAA